jgi:uncharacterized protein involved in cysteine biosynthesis
LISALSRGFQQLFDPPTRRFVILCALTALFTLVILIVSSWIAVSHLEFLRWQWAEWALDLVIFVATLFIAWLIFPAALSTTVGLFLDSVATQVERRHYPGLPSPRAQPLAEALLSSLKLASVALGLNILALPLYFSLWPPFNLFVFYGLNGYLLGREYFETIALRRLSAGEAKELWRKEKRRIFAAGVLITVMLTIPFLNLVAPVVATAFMLHLFQAMRIPERA